MRPAPLAINLTVCEKVIIEEGTRNVSLIGTFRRRRVSGFPSPPQDFVVFAALIDGLGDATIRLEISDLETGEVVLERKQSVSFPNRLTEMHLHLRITGCIFPAPGIYPVVVLVDQDWIAHRHFRIFGPEVSP